MQVVREHRDDLASRVRVLTAVVTGLLVVIATGFWFAQLVQGDYYRELAENNRLRKLPIKAPRGLIYDRKGRLLVENVPSYNLMLDRSRAGDLDTQPRRSPPACWAGRSPSPQAILAELPRRSRSSSRCCWPRTSPSPRWPASASRASSTRSSRSRSTTCASTATASRPPTCWATWARSAEEEIAKSDGSTSRVTWWARRGSSRPTTPVLRGQDGERVVVVDSRGELLEEYGRKPAGSGPEPHARRSTSTCSRRPPAGSTGRRRWGRWSPWTRATARSWPWSPRRRTTRTCSPAGSRRTIGRP